MTNAQRIVILVVGIVMLPCLSQAKCPSRSQGQSLDLNQFSGDWYMVGGTPVSGKSLSKCGHFGVKPTSDDTFTMNYTAVSRRKNHPVVFHVNARVDDDITGNWQLEGSTRVLGPFKHRIISVDYDSHVVFVVCGDSNQIIPSREFSMIWSRGKSLPSIILNKLKESLREYVKKEDILEVDHKNC